MGYGFNSLGLHRIHADTSTDNTGLTMNTQSLVTGWTTPVAHPVCETAEGVLLWQIIQHLF